VDGIQSPSRRQNRRLSEVAREIVDGSSNFFATDVHLRYERDNPASH
jgi:hypothetical protein